MFRTYTFSPLMIFNNTTTTATSNKRCIMAPMLYIKNPNAHNINNNMTIE